MSPWFGAAIALLLAAFTFVAQDVAEGETATFDRAALMAMRVPGDVGALAGPAWLPEAARDITALGSTSVLTLLVVLVAAALLLCRQPRGAVQLIATVVAATALSNTLKWLFDRPRPDLGGLGVTFTASFPSGHAMLSAVTYLTIAAVLASVTPDRRLRTLLLTTAVFLTAIIGASRVYLGFHYPTDVLAGWALGSAWALLCIVVAGRGRASSAAGTDRMPSASAATPARELLPTDL